MKKLIVLLSAILCSIVALLFVYVRVGLNYISYMVESSVFWIALGSIGALITLFFIHYQTRITRKVSAANFLLKLRESFYSDDMRARRVEMAAIFRDSPNDNDKIGSSSLEVMDFFENVGLLVKKGVIPLEYIWSGYYYWILNYWTAFQKYVYWYREKGDDVTYYDAFEYLFKRVLDFDERSRHKKVVIRSEDVTKFIEEETSL